VSKTELEAPIAAKRLQAHTLLVSRIDDVAHLMAFLNALTLASFDEAFH
jgi:hypothetical protein